MKLQHSNHRHYHFPGCSDHHSHWYMTGRQHGSHHDQSGHHRRGGFGRDGDDLTRGRKFSSDDLQLLLLALLEDKPAHGYELIRALEARSNGFYTPSPGMIYPALTYLEEISYVVVTQDGNRKKYQIAEAGREFLNTNREHADLMLAKLTHIARKMDSIRRAYSGETIEENEDNGWIPEFVKARRALKHSLIKLSGVGVKEQKRIAAILNEATEKILANKT